jgi:hypothetical protein
MKPKVEFDEIIGMYEVIFTYYGKRCHAYFKTEDAANNFKLKISKNN